MDLEEILAVLHGWLGLDIEVSVHGARAGDRETTPVRGGALVRMPVKEAFAHGFAVDREALTEEALLKTRTDADDVVRMDYEAHAVRDSGPGENDPPRKLPHRRA